MSPPVLRQWRDSDLERPAFCVTELAAVAERLKTAGYPVIWDEALPARARFYTRDPFGNRIELLRDGDGFGQT